MWLRIKHETITTTANAIMKLIMSLCATVHNLEFHFPKAQCPMLAQWGELK